MLTMSLFNILTVPTKSLFQRAPFKEPLLKSGVDSDHPPHIYGVNAWSTVLTGYRWQGKVDLLCSCA